MLQALIHLIALKAELGKLNINKLVNDPTSFNNFFKKVNHLDVGKLKNVSLDLKKLNDAEDKEVAKHTKFNTL